ncbi:hypothetical protein [Smaragdicoccus niigatensis]|uniref:hypothetical protein n=1 Tax=Smaragdicoccus niigatensis TaxID=359359 RepID=UPI000477418E|nr:hypothetical protein [Smaragdicoccus niigatensis]
MTTARVQLDRASRGSRQARAVTRIALIWARLCRAHIGFDPRWDLFVCSGMRFGFGRGGTTIGGVYLTGNNLSQQVLRHESVHAEQWARYGFRFALMYPFEELRHPREKNRFEIEAGLEDGGYSPRV